MAFIVKRFVHSLILVVLATVGGYFLCSAALNPKANFEGAYPPVPAASIAAKLNAYNMNPDVPVLTRFARWCEGIAHGSLGRTVTGGSVDSELWHRMGVSFQLLVVGSIVGALVGIAGGAVSAIRQYKFADNAISGFSYVVVATPAFVLAVALQIGAQQINRWVGGDPLVYVNAFTPGLQGGFWAHAGDRLSHLLLPTLTLVCFGVAAYSRYQRNAMLDVLHSDFIRTARAKGLTRRRALIKHGLRTAVVPMVVFFAYSFGTILAGSVVIEVVFSWHGMGEFFLNAVNTNDINSSVAMIGFSAVLILLAGVASDIAYAALDPRVRASDGV